MDPFAAPAAGGDRTKVFGGGGTVLEEKDERQLAREKAKEVLTDHFGVNFAGNATAEIDSATGDLLVRNTPEELRRLNENLGIALPAAKPAESPAPWPGTSCNDRRGRRLPNRVGWSGNNF